MSDRIHEMYRLLNECGEDTSCGCGCGAPPDPKAKGKKVLDEHPKKKTESDLLSKYDAVRDYLKAERGLLARYTDEEEVSERRKVGVRVFKVIRKLRGLRPAKSPKPQKMRAPKSAIRAVARNRHR